MDKDVKELKYKISGPVEVVLDENYKPGEEGNLTLIEFSRAIRRELSNHLTYKHPIIFTKKGHIIHYSD